MVTSTSVRAVSRLASLHRGISSHASTALAYNGLSVAATPSIVATVGGVRKVRCRAYSSRIPSSSRPSRVPVRSNSAAKPPPHSVKRTTSNDHEIASPVRQYRDTGPSQQQGQEGARNHNEEGQKEIVASESGRDVATTSDVKKMLGQDTLVVTREVEMMNIFLGFEQANRYALNTVDGQTVGYLAETEKGVLGGSIQRQILRTHRPFEATIMDTSGNIMLIIKRPFTLINSKVQIFTLDPDTTEEILVGEVHQIFHVIRRKYELFVNRGGQKGQEDMDQFAEIDEGLWAWDFMLKNDQGRPLGAISRNFRGFGRELFTDTGQYILSFDPTTMQSDLVIEDGSKKKEDSSLMNSNSGRELITSGPARALSVQERAVALATAISADFDYFSRHSQSSTGSMMPWFWMSGGGGGTAAEDAPAGAETSPANQRQDSSGIEAAPPTPGSDGAGGALGGAGTAAGYGMLGGGGRPESNADSAPSSSPEQQQQPYDPSGDFADQGQPGEVWGTGQSDPWADGDAAAQESPADDGWGWGNSGGDGGGGDGGGGGWLSGFFEE